MPKNKAIRAYALALLLICLLAGVIHLFILRFEAGDIYPAYSSLRSDPLGSRAFYESLGNFKDIAVQRNFQLPSLLKFEPHTTLLYLGAGAAANDLLPESLSKVFERLTQSGGRLVFSFLPVIKEVEENPCLSDKDNPAGKKDLEPGAENPTQKPACENKSGTSRESTPAKTDKPASRKSAAETQFVSIKEKWGIGFNFIENLPVKDEKSLSPRCGWPPAESSGRRFMAFESLLRAAE